MSVPAPAPTKSPAMLKLEALLAKHAVVQANPEEKCWEAVVSQTNDGVWFGWAGYLRSRSPNVWRKASIQGAPSRAATESVLLVSISNLTGASA